ncbi:uncharacterized protein cubi_02795 [Cryptosporidium ubiquitum]|uniref:Uncharacterized protein n=1 Tax=Cryptosporidium ubiquitum TaxID=857276 RepID=A0A1J4MIE0_9CRYT|nr:uncharacterized protein cubi_02795 [Cryptosporidium ubiquitum]OII73993.1 hypothetical protein cubi_02795 [Cryptosporidium ubiquitum]
MTRELMNKHKRIFFHKSVLLVCLILIIPFNLNTPTQEMFLQYEYSFSNIRDNYTRIEVVRGSESVRKMREALQMSIFTYFIAQKRLSDIRVSGFGLDSNEYLFAEEYYRRALNNLKIAKDNWENSIKTSPIFSCSNEHIGGNGSRGINYDLNSLFLLPRGYSGDRGVDFQMDIYEDVDPSYLPPPPQKKLNKDIINNLNLGFKFENLPAKLSKSINDRENSKKQNRFGNRGSQIKNIPKSIPTLKNFSFNTNKYSDDFYSIDKIMGNPEHDYSSGKTDELLNDISPSIKFGNFDFQNSKDLLNSKDPLNSKELLNLKLEKKPNLLNKSLKTNDTLKKPNKNEKSKIERSRGVLEREPEIPTDIAVQIEKKLGGPLKFIDVSLKDLSKNKNCKNLFMQYIRVTLTCIQLYESKSSFEELFQCSKKQIDLNFRLLQKLKKLNINYTFHNNDVSYIKNKYKIKSIKKPANFRKVKENEEFFNLLVSNGIFNSNNSSNTTDISTKNMLVDDQLKNFDDKLNFEIVSESFHEPKCVPSYLESYMKRYGFTKNEYFTNPTLSKAVNYLAALEAEFIHLTENNQRVEHDKLYTYKMLTDLIPREIINQRAQKPLCDKEEKN